MHVCMSVCCCLLFCLAVTVSTMFVVSDAVKLLRHSIMPTSQQVMAASF